MISGFILLWYNGSMIRLHIINELLLVYKFSVLITNLHKRIWRTQLFRDGKTKFIVTIMMNSKQSFENYFNHRPILQHSLISTIRYYKYTDRSNYLRHFHNFHNTNFHNTNNEHCWEEKRTSEKSNILESKKRNFKMYYYNSYDFQRKL